MTDRYSRNVAGNLLRRLAAGQISNEEFEGGFPRSPDRAVREMFFAGWSLYSDLRNHRLVGRDRLSRDTKRVVGRCILFLQTDLPYEWPSSLGFKAVLEDLLHLVTFGYARRFRVARFQERGDWNVWPFIRQSDYERAAREPMYLNGRSNRPLQPTSGGHVGVE